MLNKVTIKGIYTGSDPRGLIVGGKPFPQNHLVETDVEEDVFLSLRSGVDNGWFKIMKENYDDFLAENDRPAQKTTKPKNTETPSEESKSALKVISLETVANHNVNELNVDESDIDESDVDESSTDEPKAKKRGRKKAVVEE